MIAKIHAAAKVFLFSEFGNFGRVSALKFYQKPFLVVFSWKLRPTSQTPTMCLSATLSYSGRQGRVVLLLKTHQITLRHALLPLSIFS